jgi:hypothetical protein
MRLGRLVHQMVLVPHVPVCVYEGARRGKDWELFKSSNSGEETIYTQSERDAAMSIAHAVLSDPVAGPMLKAEGFRERRIEWERAGRKCAGTPDFFSYRALIDLKTCATADPRRWTGRFGEIRKRHYDAQVAWYADAIETCGFRRPSEVYLVAVETRAPYPVVAYRICDSELEHGRRTYTAWLEMLRVCEESNHFPGYSQIAVDVEAPEDDEMPSLDWSDEETEESEAAE